MKTGRSILILGATSEIARAAVEAVARPEDTLLLAARDENDLEFIASHFRVTLQCECHTLRFDAAQPATHELFANATIKLLGTPEIVLLATGYLGNHDRDQDNISKIIHISASNFWGVMSGIARIIPLMEQNKKGVIIVLSSVAGDRGRRSNYLYGASKSAINEYASGLRSRLHQSGIRVCTLKLGYVTTRMIYGRQNYFLAASTTKTARRIARLINHPRDIVYFPRIWWFVMIVIRHLPEPLFKRINF